ncbi:MAG TPA: glycoside hydrolase family 25 protein [Bacteroides reticulotermitis]|nr:glycoside hydrolase family 25 protein [Bacteroides reticulotermitis]HJD76030.1 glycoside hydrolase family 25 protein [Bacteroides reticulotermitis]
MPAWIRNILVFILAVFFTGAFYYFFIRPYAYRWKPCAGQKEYGVCIPCGYEVHGIDISHYQGDIDWNVLSMNRETDSPLHFVFMKATEGGDHGDDTFCNNFTEALNHGFIRGAYHFFIPSTDALKQADFFIRTVQLKPGDLPPVLDVEVTGKKNKVELQRCVKQWLDRVESHYGVKPILYTSYKFKTKYLDDSLFNAYPYWIAHYYVDSVKYQGKWDFWQHTDVGNVPGIEEDVDLNVFKGTLDELKKLTIK